MVRHTLCLFAICSCTVVVHSEVWVELPKMTPSREVTMASLRTPVPQLFELYTSETTSSPKKNTSEITKIESTENSLKTQQNYTKGFKIDKDGVSMRVNNNDTFLIASERNGDIDDSYIIEETIKETANDFIIQPHEGLIGKLEYLKQLENKLLFQTRMYAEGIWSDRQARGKKLLGFPSMEGALMTIAFLTFAVFLIKIVMQFIQGLQNAEQTLLLHLSSTPPPVRLSNRPKRAARNLAAAQILRYIDEYSIKHKLHCDFQ